MCCAQLMYYILIEYVSVKICLKHYLRNYLLENVRLIDKISIDCNKKRLDGQ